MKTRDDVKANMSELYDAAKSGEIDLKTAGELANITGKWLKADQLELAWALFIESGPAHYKPKLLANAA